MQFHHDGYVDGNPRVQPAAGAGLERAEELPDAVDVLIVGTGPAGLITAAQLAQFPLVSTRIIERRPGRLAVGQADGIQARSVETFQAFGFANRVIEEAYQITTMSFWKPDPDDPSRIVRTARTPDDPSGISEFPHLIVNQARVQDFFVEAMQSAPAMLAPDYGVELLGLDVDSGGEGGHPVAVRVRHHIGPRAGQTQVIRARYVVGADGARSHVREAIGRALEGRQAMHAWGVMDALAVTDFPDIRIKCAIQSHDGGSILHIPREGGHLFRMYVDLGEVAPDDNGNVRATTIDEIIAKANQILSPYTLEVRHVAWHSVYEVAHRLTDRFDDLDPEEVGSRTPRVFIAGLPHPQRQGRSGHERLDAGRLQHRLEARSRSRRPRPRGPAGHVLSRTPRDRQEPHRLRQAVVDADGRPARGSSGPLPTGGLLRKDLRVPSRFHDPLRTVPSSARPTTRT